MPSINVGQTTETETAQPISVAMSFLPMGQAVEDNTVITGFQVRMQSQPPGTQGGGPYGTSYINLTFYPHQSRGPRSRYAQSVLAEAEAYWRFDEIEKYDNVNGPLIDYGGPITDETGRHHLELFGMQTGDTGLPGLLPGDSSTARFLGAGSIGPYAVPALPYGAWMDSADFTIEGLILTGDKGHVIWGRASSSLLLWELGTTVSTGQLYFKIGSITLLGDTIVTTLSPSGSGGSTPDTVHHFAVRRRGSTVELIVDGDVDGTGATGTFTGPVNPTFVPIGFCFGNRYPGANVKYYGQVDEFAYYTHALSDAKIAEHVDLWQSGQSVALDVAENVEGDKTLVQHHYDADSRPWRYRTIDNEQLVRLHREGQFTYVDAVLRSRPWAFWNIQNYGGYSDYLIEMGGDTAPHQGESDPYQFDNLPDMSPNQHGATMRSLGSDEDGVPYGGNINRSSGDDYILGQVYPFSRYVLDPELDPDDPDSYLTQNMIYHPETRDDWTYRFLPYADNYAQSDQTLATTEVTVEAWVMIPTAINGIAYGDTTGTTASVPLIVFAEGVNDPDFDMCLYFGTDNRLRWLTGHGGSREIITMPSAFPVNKRIAHVVASVGPAGSKLRVDGVTVVTGSNTGAWGQPQYAFLGGAGGRDADWASGGLWFSHNEFPKVYLVAPVIYDRQLSDAETDGHLRAGRSYYMLLNRWGQGTQVPWNGSSFGSGGWPPRNPYDYAAMDYGPGPERMLPSEPFLGSTHVTDLFFLLATSTGGQPIVTQFQTNLIVKPDGLGPTDTMCLVTNGTWMRVPNYAVDSWAWQIRNERLEFTYMYGARNNTTNPWPQPPTSASIETFTHSAPILDGTKHVIGLKLNGTAVELWVDGVGQSFTRTSATYYREGGSSDSWYFQQGRDISGIHQFVGDWTAIWMVWPNALDTTGESTRRYNAAPGDTVMLLQQAAIWQYVDTDQILETETAFEIIANNSKVDVRQTQEADTAYPIAAAFAQAITLGRPSEVDETALGMPLDIILGRAVEVDEPIHVGGTIPVTITLGVPEYLEEVFAVILIAPPEIVLTVLTPVLNQAPGMVGVTISGGFPLDVVTVAIDGTDVMTVELDSDGNFGPFSVPVDDVLGTQGDHVLSAAGATATFTITLPPTPFPETPPPDPDPVDVPESVINDVRHWVFQDLVPVEDGGIGTWVMPINPSNEITTSPFPVKQFASRSVTANVVNRGRWHTFQGQTPPKEWQFGGYLPTQEMVERLLEFRNINRRFYLIDHRNRAWIVVLTNVEIVPRLRHIWVGLHQPPLEDNDWGHDYTATAMILDPDWMVPE